MTDYTPIDCGLHDRYELAVMQRRTVALRWRDAAGATFAESVLPVDLFTRAGEEFMRVRRADGSETTIRLDFITACDPA